MPGQGLRMTSDHYRGCSRPGDRTRLDDQPGGVGAGENCLIGRGPAEPEGAVWRATPPVRGQQKELHHDRSPSHHEVDR